METAFVPTAILAKWQGSPAILSGAPLGRGGGDPAAKDDLVLRDVEAPQALDVLHLERLPGDVVDRAGRVVDEVVVRVDLGVEDDARPRRG